MSQGHVVPSSRNPSPYLIGRDCRGHWVVQDQSGLRGGLFVSRVEAHKFAMFENGHRPQAAILVPEVLELRFDADASAVRRSAPAAAMPSQPRVEKARVPLPD